MSYDPTKVAFCDSETLGLNPHLHPIWELAIILPDTGEEHIWQVRPTPTEVSAADPIAVRISGFDKRYDDAAALRKGETVDRFSELLRGRHIVGAVPSFDEERLRLMYLSVHGTPDRFPWHYRLVDVESGMLAKLGTGPGIEPDEMAAQLGVSTHPDKHSALGDARWVRAVFEALVGGPE